VLFRSIVLQDTFVEPGLAYHAPLAATVFQVIQHKRFDFGAKLLGCGAEMIGNCGTVSFFPWASKQTDNFHFTPHGLEKTDNSYLYDARISAKGISVKEGFGLPRFSFSCERMLLFLPLRSQ
jgi:hypothetical protein